MDAKHDNASDDVNYVRTFHLFRLTIHIFDIEHQK